MHAGNQRVVNDQMVGNPAAQVQNGLFVVYQNAVLQVSNLQNILLTTIG
jgi:hypothetical protein